MQTLNGKVPLVTGANRGVRRGSALEFLGAGATARNWWHLPHGCGRALVQTLFTLLLVFLSCASCEAQNFTQRADQYLNKYSREQFMGSVLVARAGKVLF